jgi:hypothetical protein
MFAPKMFTAFIAGVALRVPLVVAIALPCGSGHMLRADEPLKLQAEAPPDHAVLDSTLGGAYFVAKDLKEQYEKLLDRVEALKSDVNDGRLPADEALHQIEELEPRLEALRQELEARKVLVSAAKMQQQTEEVLFDLGAQRRLIITADQIHVVGWEGPQVKCVLTKTLLAANDAPETEEFKAMKLIHRHSRAADLVGRTDEEVAADERAFLAEKRDKPLSEAQLAARRAFVQEIQSSYDHLREYQGKEVDLLEMEGLTHQEGNRQVSVEIQSKGGGATFASQWRRHAALTVYVPKCEGVLLRGCLKGVAVESLNAPLTLTDAGSLDRDYDAKSTIKDISGPLAIYNVPLNRVEKVRGNVKIVATVEYANTGTTHTGGKRIAYTPPPRELTIAEVGGDLSAWFSRVNLTLTGVKGLVDVRNEAGATKVVLEDKLAERPHRVISESGRIEVNANKESFASLPVMALTDNGAVETNADDAMFDSLNFTTGATADGSRRNWRGIKSKENADSDRFRDFERPARVLNGTEDEPSLTLISRSGSVSLMVNE